MTVEVVYATFIQRHNSGMVGRFPYDRIPTRKIFAVISRKAATVAAETIIDTRTCTIGGSLTSVRTNIVSGPNTGAIDNTTNIGVSGLVMSGPIKNTGSIITMITAPPDP